MSIALTPESGVPLYLQVAAGLRELIGSGGLQGGEELPSVRAMGAELRVNYHTVARAYRILEEEGLLSRRRGGPFRVVEGADTEAAMRVLRGEVEALCARADRLGVGLDDLLKMIRRAMREARSIGEVS